MESRLERCSLKEAGISASGVQKFLDEIQAGGYHLHSLMLTRHGKVAYECSWKPYQLDEVHLMHSFTKGLVATAIGILEGENRISLEDSLISYFPEYQVDDQDGKLEKITIRTLLTMSNGHPDVPDRHGCDDEVRTFLEYPIVHEPGTVFMYDSMGTNMLAAVVKRVTGYNLFQFPFCLFGIIICDLHGRNQIFPDQPQHCFCICLAAGRHNRRIVILKHDAKLSKHAVKPEGVWYLAHPYLETISALPVLPVRI